MNALQTTTLEVDDADLRAHRRVDVKLQVVMQLDRTTSCITTTRNISEGVLSNEGDTESQRYLMRVVRHQGDIVALSFAANGDTAP